MTNEGYIILIVLSVVLILWFSCSNRKSSFSRKSEKCLTLLQSCDAFETGMSEVCMKLNEEGFSEPSEECQKEVEGIYNVCATLKDPGKCTDFTWKEQVCKGMVRACQEYSPDQKSCLNWVGETYNCL